MSATKLVAIVVLGTLPVIEGGGFVNRVVFDTPDAWCEYYGLEVTDGTVILYKGVDENFCSSHGFSYTPGDDPVEATDWDGPARECGGGLHFSPSPRHTLEFMSDAKRFVACVVALADLVAHVDAEYPQKIKGRRALKRWEVDINGKRIEVTS